MPRKNIKIKISQERKFSPYFLDLKKIVPEEQEFEKPMRRGFFDLLKWTTGNAKTQRHKNKETKLRINFITPGEKRIRREKEEMEINKRIDKHSKILSVQRFQDVSEYSNIPWKPVICFILICFVFVSSLQALSFFQELKNKKQVVLAASLEAYQNLSSGEFEKAKQKFLDAQKELNRFGFLNYIIPHLSQARHILEAGEIMAEIEDKIFNFQFLISDPQLLISISEIYPKIRLVENHLSKINANFLPKEYRENFLENRKKLEILSSGLKSLVKYIPDLSKILGFKETQHYLFIFQNNNEIRPTGGFMGSLAFLDLYQGQIKKLEIPSGGPYDFRKLLKVNVAPPKPLRRINYQWQLQDANWFPDFSTSAEKILWFLENMNLHEFNNEFSRIDGIIAINASFMPKILKITGPIEMPKYKRIITSENFIEETQKIVELESDKKKAKEFIADLMPVVLDRILKKDTEKYERKDKKTQTEIFSKFFLVLFNALEEKEIQLYFTDKNLENKIKELGWAGEIKANPLTVTEGINDYLMVVNTNIRGGKTDGVIKEKIFHQVEIQQDGSLINQVSITRTHQGQKGDYFTGNRNDNYLRIYVPQGSILLEASGDFTIPAPGNFRAVTQGAVADEDLMKVERNAVVDETSGTRITQEFGKTCFANWVQIEPGETATVVFKYKLPFVVNKSVSNPQDSIFYSLLWQKQSGTQAEIESQLILPESYQIIWKYPEDLIIQNKELVKFNSILDRDKFLSLKWNQIESKK